MNRNLLAAVAAVALVAGGTGYFLGRSGNDGGQSGATAEQSAEAAQPQQIEMDAARISAAEIQLLRVAETPFGAEIVAQGAVTAPPTGLAVLTAGADGRITRISKQLGDPVGRGEGIATIESRDAAAISGDLRSAQARASLAKANYDREQRLYKANVTARADLEAARAEYESASAEVAKASGSAAAAGVSGRFVTVRSPIAGRVTAAPAVLGSYVTSETELFRIADTRVVQVEVSVPVSDGSRIRPGARAVIEADGREIEAKVRSAAPAATADSRSIGVVLIPIDSSALTPGQFIRARIVASDANGATGVSVVPEAVQSVGGRDVVFVRTTKGFAVRPVQLGARTSEAAQILSGVRPGETIAGKNAFLLKAELEKGAGEEE